jgi:hypothetical protein
MASAIDWGCGDGVATGLWVGPGEGCAVLGAAGAAVAGGAADGAPCAVGDDGEGVGAGLDSSPAAGPVRPGPTTSASASGTTPKYFRNGVRD